MRFRFVRYILGWWSAFGIGYGGITMAFLLVGDSIAMYIDYTDYTCDGGRHWAV